MTAIIATTRHGACSCSTDAVIAWHDGPCTLTAEGTGTPSPVPSVHSAGRAACAAVAVVKGGLVLRRMGSGVMHLAFVSGSELVPTTWIGPEYQAIHTPTEAACGAVLRPDHRGLVAMREGTEPTCSTCKRVADRLPQVES